MAWRATKQKLSGPVAIGLNSRESFRARQLEKNKMADTEKMVEQLSGLSVLEIAGLVKATRRKVGRECSGARRSSGGSGRRRQLRRRQLKRRRLSR